VATIKTGRGRSRWRASSYEVTISRRGSPGDGRRIVSRPAGCGSRIEGQTVPGSWGALASRRAQVGIDFAGDVTLEAADDFLLRQAFFGAPVGVGAGRSDRHHRWVPKDLGPAGRSNRKTTTAASAE
jgi:hypothetical protein